VDIGASIAKGTMLRPGTAHASEPGRTKATGTRAEAVRGWQAVAEDLRRLGMHDLRVKVAEYASSASTLEEPSPNLTLGPGEDLASGLGHRRGIDPAVRIPGGARFPLRLSTSRTVWTILKFNVRELELPTSRSRVKRES
jgi:hypothetical protein